MDLGLTPLLSTFQVPLLYPTVLNGVALLFFPSCCFRFPEWLVWSWWIPKLAVSWQPYMVAKPPPGIAPLMFHGLLDWSLV